jgi:hypothetical protein
MKKFFTAFLIVLAASAVYASDFIISVGDVSDKRSTEQFNAGLDLKLKATGDIINDAKGLKAKIIKAVDDTGRDLLRNTEDDFFYNKGWTALDKYAQGGITVKLKNPARKASVVKELAVEISLFVPKNDPASTVVIKGFMSKLGKPLASPSLKEAKVEIVAMDKNMHEKLKASKEKSSKGDDAAKQFGEAVGEAFSSMFGSMMGMGENSIVLQIKDPAFKIISIEFTDETGKQIQHRGHMSTGTVSAFEFDKPMPKNAQLKIHVATQRSMITKTVKLADIPLP